MLTTSDLLEVELAISPENPIELSQIHEIFFKEQKLKKKEIPKSQYLKKIENGKNIKRRKSLPLHSDKSHENTFSKTMSKDDRLDWRRISKNANIRPVRPNSICSTNISPSVNSKNISKTIVDDH